MAAGAGSGIDPHPVAARSTATSATGRRRENCCALFRAHMAGAYHARRWPTRAPRSPGSGTTGEPRLAGQGTERDQNRALKLNPVVRCDQWRGAQFQNCFFEADRGRT